MCGWASFSCYALFLFHQQPINEILALIRQPFSMQITLNQRCMNAADIAGKPQLQRPDEFALLGEYLVQFVFRGVDRTNVTR